MHRVALFILGSVTKKWLLIPGPSVLLTHQYYSFSVLYFSSQGAWCQHRKTLGP